MKTCNKSGVPLWAIRRLLMCRVNLNKKGYKSFHISQDGRIFFDGKYGTHIDQIYYDQEIKGYCIPVEFIRTHANV